MSWNALQGILSDVLCLSKREAFDILERLMHRVEVFNHLCYFITHSLNPRWRYRRHNLDITVPNDDNSPTTDSAPPFSVFHARNRLPPPLPASITPFFPALIENSRWFSSTKFSSHHTPRLSQYDSNLNPSCFLSASRLSLLRTHRASCSKA